MADIDLTLKLTNPAIFNTLHDWSTKGLNVKLNLDPSFKNIKQLKQDLKQQIGAIPVDIDPKLGNVTQLVQQIKQAIGNVSINVSISNLAQLNQQVQQLFSTMGINATVGGPKGKPATKISTRALVNELVGDISKGRPTAEALGFIRQGTLQRSVGVQEGRRTGGGYSAILSRSTINKLNEAPAKRELERSKIYSSQIRRGAVDLDFPQHLTNLETFARQHQGTVFGDRLSETINQLRYANDQASNRNLGGGRPQRSPSRGSTTAFQSNLVSSSQKLERRQSRYQDIFENDDLLSIALHGPEKAARNFERERALQPGTVDHTKVKRFSSNLNRVFDPSNFREIAISTAVGGLGGGIGGTLGATGLGRAGIYGGATIGQFVEHSIVGSFEKLYAALVKVSSAGLELEKNMLGVAAALTTNSRVVGRSGETVSTLDAFKVQRERAEELLLGTRKDLSPLGINQSQQAGLLRGVISGAGQGGFNLSKEQTLRLTKIIGGTTAVANEDLLQTIPRLVNDVSDLISGAPTASRSELGQQFRQILPEIKSAQATGDGEKLLKAFEKFAPVIEALTISTDSAAVVFRKLSAASQELETTFGQAFNKAIIPGLNQLVSALNKPEVQDGLAKLGSDIGYFFNILIEVFAGLVAAINPKNVTEATVAFVDFSNKVLDAIPGLKEIKAILKSLGITDLDKNAEMQKRTLRVNLANDEAERKLNERKKELGQAPLKTGEDIGTGAFRKSDLRVESLPNPILDLKKQLQNIDEGTPEGKFKADSIRNQLAQLGEGNTGNLSPEVLAAQQKRAEANYKIQQTLRGTNQQTISGSVLGNVLGIEQKQISGDVTSDVAKQQKSAALVSGVTSLVGSFYNLQKSVLDSVFALNDLTSKYKEMRLVLKDLEAQQKTLGDRQLLNSLQGKDKLYALAQQVKDAGGTVPLDLLNKTGLSLFNDDSDKETRQRKILEQQFTVEAQNYLLTPNRNEIEKSSLQRQISGLQNNISQEGIDKKLAAFNQSKSLLDFAGQFGEGKTKEIFGDKPFDEALKFFNKEAKGIADIGDKGDSFKRALQETFNDNYYSKMGNEFKKAVESII